MLHILSGTERFSINPPGVTDQLSPGKGTPSSQTHPPRAPVALPAETTAVPPLLLTAFTQKGALPLHLGLMACAVPGDTAEGSHSRLLRAQWGYHDPLHGRLITSSQGLCLPQSGSLTDTECLHHQPAFLMPRKSPWVWYSGSAGADPTSPHL